MTNRIQKPKIKDCLPLINGVWTHIDYQFPEIFDIDSSQLDIIFMSNWSMRTAAPILHLLHDDDDTTMLTQEELVTLGAMINGLYKHKWDKLMDVAIMEYDPIHNFSDHLVEEVEYGEDITGTKSGSTSTSNTRTDNLTKTETDRKGYTDTFNNTDARTKSLTESTQYNSTETKEQTVAGYTEQKVDGFTEQITAGFTEQKVNGYTNQVTDGYTQQVNNGYTEQVTAGYTSQDPNSKRTTEELVSGFNSANYENANKTITDEGKVENSQGKIENSQGKIGSSQGKIESNQGKVENSQGKIETSQGKIETNDGTIRDTHAGTDTVTDSGTDNVVHTGTIARVNNGTLTEQNTGTQTNAGSGTNSENMSSGKDGERSREVTRIGNIGNISTQKLLNEEIELWKYNFIHEMMRDVIGMISLPIYEQ